MFGGVLALTTQALGAALGRHDEADVVHSRRPGLLKRRAVAFDLRQQRRHRLSRAIPLKGDDDEAIGRSEGEAGIRLREVVRGPEPVLADRLPAEAPVDDPDVVCVEAPGDHIADEGVALQAMGEMGVLVEVLLAIPGKALSLTTEASSDEVSADLI